MQARDEGWLAEHMLILGHHESRREEDLHRRGVPVGVRQDQPGDDESRRCRAGRIETVGDDIAWMKFGADGRLYAINPEAGLLRRRARHQREDQSERDAHGAGQLDLHQLRASPPDGDVWWEEMTDAPPAELTDWLRRPWTPGVGTQGRAPQRALHRARAGSAR